MLKTTNKKEEEEEDKEVPTLIPDENEKKGHRGGEKQPATTPGNREDRALCPGREPKKSCSPADGPLFAQPHSPSADP